MFLGLFTRKDINQGVAEWESTKGAVLLDVRTKEEYADSHIKGSVNVPLNELETIRRVVPDKATPIFVYCLSGGRSASAAAYLKRSGYSHVYDIGGINSYRGETVSCSI
ncbi:MAG TPA: rhodanese-like domain-containing protein [Firmicutes bacterium]|nr:rhodanese-like domain-containing protein [Bacillota bacterium]